MNEATVQLLRSAALVGAIAGCVAVMILAGPSTFVLVHLFYFPIVLAAFWYHVPGGALGGALAGVAAGPLFMASITPSEYAPGAWLVRAAFFVGVGVTVGAGRALLARRRRRVEAHAHHLAHTYARTLKSLVYLLEHHDEETASHCERVATNALRVGRRLGFGKADNEILYWAAYLHDIGKLATPARMLLKEGPLSPEEYEVMKQHAEIGANALRSISADFDRVADAVWAHHERWDGHGYPRGLSGPQIPRFGRILAVVDAFEAMTSDRPYRKALSVAEATKVLAGESGRQFDPEVVSLYLELLAEGQVHTQHEDGPGVGPGLPEVFSLPRGDERGRLVAGV